MARNKGGFGSRKGTGSGQPYMTSTACSQARRQLDWGVQDLADRMRELYKTRGAQIMPDGSVGVTSESHGVMPMEHLIVHFENGTKIIRDPNFVPLVRAAFEAEGVRFTGQGGQLQAYKPRLQQVARDMDRQDERETTVFVQSNESRINLHADDDEILDYSDCVSPAGKPFYLTQDEVRKHWPRALRRKAEETGEHVEYGYHDAAMTMVGERHSKRSLVDLVTATLRLRDLAEQRVRYLEGQLKLSQGVVEQREEELAELNKALSSTFSTANT